jgi:ferredoxin-NADP reductase
VTALQLLSYICAALLLQLVGGIGVASWHRSRAKASRSVDANDRVQSTTPARAGWREFRVVRREFEDEAHTQCSFYLEPVDSERLPSFRPGQFLTLSLPVGKDRSITRCYSLSDAPDPLRYRITVKRVPAPAGRPDLPPGAASDYLHQRVRVGDVVKARGPDGRFCIDTDPGTAAVFIAGGVGITPLMSMLRWCLVEQPERTLHLYYGARNSKEQAFKRSLEDLATAHANFHLTVVYSQPGETDLPGRDYQYTGHVDIDLLRRTLPHGRHRFYVCGPAPMLQSLVPALTAWGVPRQDLGYEAFGPASVRSASPTAERAATRFEVRFRRSGRTLMWDGRDESLLEFAERYGMSIDSGCRSGSCGSCATALISGTVRYDHKPDHDIPPGHCLLCVSQPESALVLEA